MGFFKSIGSVFEDAFDVVEEVGGEIIDATDDLFDASVEFAAENPELIAAGAGAAFGAPPQATLGLLGAAGGGGVPTKQTTQKTAARPPVRQQATRSVASAAPAQVAAVQPTANGFPPQVPSSFLGGDNLLIFGGLGVLALLLLQSQKG